MKIDIENTDFDDLKIDLTRLSREQLEQKLMDALRHLHKGMKLVSGAQEVIQWLGETALMCNAQVVELEPALKPECDKMAEKIRQVASIKE